jgi:hypothetical protein
MLGCFVDCGWDSYATLADISAISCVCFLGPKTQRRLHGDWKDGDARHLEKRKKKTSDVVDAVTTSVETGGRSWRRKSDGRAPEPGVIQPQLATTSGRHPCGARNSGAQGNHCRRSS